MFEKKITVFLLLFFFSYVVRDRYFTHTIESQVFNPLYSMDTLTEENSVIPWAYFLTQHLTRIRSMPKYEKTVLTLAIRSWIKRFHPIIKRCLVPLEHCQA